MPAARLARLVLAERHRAIRPNRGNEQRAATPDAWAEPPGENVVAAGQPHVIGRHALLSVPLDQRGQGVEVVPLEGIDVACQELALGFVDGGCRVIDAEAARLERRPRSLERAVDRGHGRVEELRHLGGFPAQHLAEDQDGPLAGREVLKRRHECQPDRLVRHRCVGGITRGEEGAVGNRLDPRDLRTRVQVRFDRLLRRPEVHRQGPPLAALDHVEADVRRDAEKPRTQRSAALEVIEAAPCPEQRLLHRVLCLERRPQHPIAVPGQGSAVLLEGVFELARTNRDSCLLHEAHATSVLSVVVALIDERPSERQRPTCRRQRRARPRRASSC